MKKLWFLISCLLASQAIASDLADFYNPKPEADDVIVAMPCDLKMVFRKVYTTDAKLVMDDLKFEGGLSATDNQASEALNDRYIQGAFHDDEGYYFLMGKYEVTELQYQALTSDKCPGKPGAKMKLPKTKISWFEAMEAARAYSLFLAKDKSTPKIGSTKAFARLPTDSEFEFAVRGGRAVSSSQFAAPLFFTEGTLSDYAWAQSARGSGKVSQVGRLKPNPLGIYDLLGNVQEMMQDGFYATRLGRLHGQLGGFIARGGSFRTNAQNMTAALRVEKPYYQNGQELKADDLGFRLVLSVPVMREREDVAKLNEEVAKLGYDDADGEGQQAANTIAKLDAIIESSQQENQDLKAQNEKLSAALLSLRQDMLKANEQRDRQRAAAITAALRLGGFLCSNIATERQKVLTEDKNISRVNEALKKSPDNKLLHNRLVSYQARQADASKTLNYYVSYYSDHLTDVLANYDLKQVAGEEGNARLALGEGKSDLPTYISLFIEHLAYARDHKGQELNKAREFYAKKCYAVHEKYLGELNAESAEN